MFSREFRLFPFAVAAWILSWIITGRLLDDWLFCLLIVGSCLLLILAISKSRQAIVVALLIFIITMSVLVQLRVWQRHSFEFSQNVQEGAVVQAEATVKIDPVYYARKGIKTEFAWVNLELSWIESHGVRIVGKAPIKLNANAEFAASLRNLSPGTQIKFTAVVKNIEPGSSFVAVLKLLGSPKKIRSPTLVDAVINQFRQGLKQACASNDESQAAILPSLVVGDTSALKPKIYEYFQATSLAHLLAVSGTNLTLLLTFVVFVAKRIGIRGYLVRVISISGVAFFVLLCRGEVSVVRAAAMGTMAIVAVESASKSNKTIYYLQTSVISLLIIDPWMSRSWGFGLSVAATFGIICWARKWRYHLATWLPNWAADAFVVPLAAQLATQPLVTALNGQISVVGVIANMLVGPFIGPATILGVIATLLSPFGTGIASIFAYLGCWFVQPILWVAEYGSKMPNAVLIWGNDLLAIIGLVSIIILLIFVIPKILSRRGMSLTVLALLLVSSTIRVPSVKWLDSWQIVFCDVGQGDATVMRASSHQTLLIDTGPDDQGIINCLNKLAIDEISLLVLTHYHSDHIGGLEAVLNKYSVKQIQVSPYNSPVYEAAKVIALAKKYGILISIAKPGQFFQFRDLRWQVISAGIEQVLVSPLASSSTTQNDSSIVGIAQFQGFRVLMTGDAELLGQSQTLRLAEQLNINLKVQILKVPHHGSNRQYQELWKASAAKIAIASCGIKNDYGHPAPKTLKLIAKFGMRLQRTDRNGDIAIWINAGQLKIATNKS